LPSSALHLRPEIVLVNPSNSTSTNNGNITVASNWNFGAGVADANGNISLFYRTTDGREPGTLTLRAVNNVQINATITDGFFLPYKNSALPDILDPSTTTTTAVPSATDYYNEELVALGVPNAFGNSYIGASGMFDENGIKYVLSDTVTVARISDMFLGG